MGLEGYGLTVTGREPIHIEPTDHNREYLETKRSKLGHILPELVEPALGDGGTAPVGGLPRNPPEAGEAELGARREA